MVTEEIRAELENALAPFGYYFAQGGDKGELNLTGVEVGLAASAVLLWALKDYAKAFFNELGKGTAKKLTAPAKLDQREFSQQLKEIRAELKEVRDHVRHLSPPDFAAHEDLVQYLMTLGLSRRAANKAATGVRPILTTGLPRLLDEDPD